MQLNKINDKELLARTKNLVQKERETLTEIINHLREVERRRLFCDLGFKSLFEYAVKELKYSEGQAGRRLQAMRLIKELPQVEEKIKKGSLSLSNICQAQSYFRESQKTPHTGALPNKLKILQQLENKSSREGQKILITFYPTLALPKERERLVSPDHTQVSFIMNTELKRKITELKSLLGPNEQNLSMAELVEKMTDLSLKALTEKRFGKKRAVQKNESKKHIHLKESPSSETKKYIYLKQTPAQELRRVKSNNKRYISKELKYQVWQRDKSSCAKCGSKSFINIDHIRPVAMGGLTELKNLRLLCFNCNQRAAIKVFGKEKIESYYK